MFQNNFHGNFLKEKKLETIFLLNVAYQVQLNKKFRKGIQRRIRSKFQQEYARKMKVFKLLDYLKNSKRSKTILQNN